MVRRWPVWGTIAGVLVVIGGCGSSETDEPPQEQPAGCIQVDGQGDYGSISEAIAEAPPRATVGVCDGTYDEQLVIDKPLSLQAESGGGVVVTGAGAEAVLVVTAVEGQVIVDGVSVDIAAGADETRTGVQIEGSTNVMLRELDIFFGGGDAGHAPVGLDVRGSSVLVQGLDINQVGLDNPAGGTGVYVAEGSSAVLRDLSLGPTGSFGVHAVDSSLELRDSTVGWVNRPPGFGAGDAEGSAVFAERGVGEVIVDGCTLEGGEMVGVWVDGDGLRVSNSEVRGFLFGAYLPGDVATADQRRMVLYETLFDGPVEMAAYAVGGAVVTGVEVRGGAQAPRGVQIVAPAATVELRGNSVRDVGGVALQVGSGGAAAVAEVIVEGNEIEGVTGGNGLVVSGVSAGTLRDNTVSGVDYVYAEDEGGDPVITTGFGVAIFDAEALLLQGNDVSGAEYAGLVAVNSVLDVQQDTYRDGTWLGLKFVSSQATITNTEVERIAGVGIQAGDSDLQISDSVVSGCTAGPDLVDLDGVDDPGPGEAALVSAGHGVESYSVAGVSGLLWRRGSITGNDGAALLTQDSHLQLYDAVITDNATWQHDDGSFDSAVLIVGAGDSGGHEISGNDVQGAGGAAALYVYDGGILTLEDNTLCGGQDAVVLLQGSYGGSVTGNSVGGQGGCGEPTWSRGMGLYGGPEVSGASLLVAQNDVLSAVDAGVELGWAGAATLRDNTFAGSQPVGLRVVAEPPVALWLDGDGDGLSPAEGDCDDTDAAVGPEAAEQVGNRRDDDCDGVTDDGNSTVDSDGDGFAPQAGDCDDNDSNLRPGLEEVPGDGLDNDCDGYADIDAAGLPRPEVALVGNGFTEASVGLSVKGGRVTLAPAGLGGVANWFSGNSTAGLLVSDSTVGHSTLPSEPEVVVEATGWFDGVSGDCVVVDARKGHLELGPVDVSDCGGRGLWVLGAEATVRAEGTYFGTSGLEGVLIEAGDVELSQCDVWSNGDHGVHVLGASSLAIEGGALSQNAGFGLRCDGGAENPELSTVQITACTPDEVSDNAAGSYEFVNGCDRSACP